MENVSTATVPRFETLELWRKHFELTLGEAARLIGITTSHYRSIEIGETSPRAVLAEQIIDKTSVPLSALRGRCK